MNRQSLALIWTIGVLFVSCSRSVAPFHSTENDQGIEIRQGKERILFYQVEPKSQGGKFERASYIHPLYSLDGNVLTEDFPSDHPHHHGIYSAWHQIIVNDTLIGDGWTGENLSWKVVDTQLNEDNGRISIRSDVLWNSKLDGRTVQPIVRESLTITVNQAEEQHRIIDYDFVLIPLKDGVRIGGSNDDKGYGGFSLRFKLPEDIRFIAGSGEVEAQVVSVDAGPWMDFAGTFDGVGTGPSGVVVLSHPSNPGHPQRWILRKSKSMQNPAFPGREPALLPAEGFNFRYRLVVYRGQLEKAVINRLYQEYSTD